MKEKKNKNPYAIESIYDYLVPTVIEKSKDGERAYDIYSRLLKDRIIFIGDGIDDNLAAIVIAQLLFLDKEDKEKDIYMYIDSPGGIISSGLAIFDTMNYIKSDVVTIGMGLCASMAAFLLAGGTKGKRWILPNTEVLIHQPLISGGLSGQATDVDIEVKRLLRHKNILTEYLVQFTGQKKERIAQDIERDYWMSSTEAKDYGIVDVVLKYSKKNAWKPIIN